MMRQSLLRRAVALTATAALVLGGLVLLAPSASAAPQTERITFTEATHGPVDGVLANQVGFSIDQGSGVNDFWGLPNDVGPTTWTFDRPVDVRFGVGGLNTAGESVRLPQGVVVEALHENHSWDENTSTISRAAGTCSAQCVSTFALADTTALTAEPVGAPNSARAIAFVEVTYDVPVASIASPLEGGVYIVGDGTVLDYTCADGTGEVVGGASTYFETIDNGDPIDTLGPGVWTIDVACVDEHGAIGGASVTFEVATSPAPTCKEDGLQAFQEPYFPSDPTANGVSKGVHEETEPLVRDAIDPLVTSLGLPALEPVVHDLNCGVVEPVENILDPILIPITTQVGKLLRGLFG